MEIIIKGYYCESNEGVDPLNSVDGTRITVERISASRTSGFFTTLTGIKLSDEAIQKVGKVLAEDVYKEEDS